jgi:hypothetical protein
MNSSAVPGQVEPGFSGKKQRWVVLRKVTNCPWTQARSEERGEERGVGLNPEAGTRTRTRSRLPLFAAISRQFRGTSDPSSGARIRNRRAAARWTTSCLPFCLHLPHTRRSSSFPACPATAGLWTHVRLPVCDYCTVDIFVCECRPLPDSEPAQRRG